MTPGSEGSGLGGGAAQRIASPASQKPGNSRETGRHEPSSDTPAFSDCLKARTAERMEAADAGSKPEAVREEKTADDQSADDKADEVDSAGEPQGFGLVAMLLQTILAMPPRSDRGAADAPPDVVEAGSVSAAAAASSDAALAALKTDLGKTLDTSTAQLVVADGATAHDTVPDALLALLNVPASAVTGTDRAAAVAAPATSAQPPTHGELAEPLAERIIWMTDTARAQGGQATQEARISLHPAELGSLQIRIELAADGSTKISFDVQTPQARQAIEASLPLLRDLLSPNGANASTTTSFELSGGLSQQQPRHTPSSWATAGNQGSAEASDTQADARPALRTRIGLLDHFA
ncbi:MAG: flagellar hook-length control protein FliK [Hydrocarboniphaga sp.]|uniref:flagellar hook-length control protein FliK n=1 Tax=Hydrocarboniphaga sp. TaxID=2033016 RepID=UPI00260468DE|nr:flagellar hook-length control protein FliK [Hydrocarboniphaga sp.]MDB5969840.1 flagellar hook-length control protein FliK [Hydrocarboniphaga sp.]